MPRSAGCLKSSACSAYGAEHKTINAYESGAPLTVERVREFTLIHPRCGTSFLLVVLLINWIISFLLVRDWSLGHVLSHVPLIPLIAASQLSAASFGRELSSCLGARASRPSLAFQKLTTREPDDQMARGRDRRAFPVPAADGVAPAEYDTTLAGGPPLSEPLIEPKQNLYLNARADQAT